MLRRDNRPVYEILSENRASKRKAMLRKISLILGCLALPLLAQADEEERTVSAAKAATGAARNLISNFSTQSFGPTMPIFRYRLGLNESDLRGAAAGDEETEDSGR